MNDLARTLPRLSKDELLDLQKRIGALLQFAGSAPANAVKDTTDVDIVLDCLVSVLRFKGIEYSSAMMLRKATVYPSFVQKVPAIMQYLRQATTNRNKLRALTTLAVTLLYSDLSRMGLAISSRTIMAHIHRLPAILNRSFPGYAQSSLLGMIVGERKAK